MRMLQTRKWFPFGTFSLSSCLLVVWLGGCLVAFEVGPGLDGGGDRAAVQDGSPEVEEPWDGGGRDARRDGAVWEDAEAPLCGNGVLDAGEGCDDGNQESGDGCDASCAVEDYFSCEGSPSVCTCRVLVNEAAVPPDHQDGRTWDTAFAAVQAGIDRASQLLEALAVARCQVWVAGATYYVYEADESDTISLADGVDLYGGFCGTEERLSERPADVLGTCPAVLDGREGLSPDSRQVNTILTALGTGDATVDGFVIQQGRNETGGGAGLYVDGFAVLVRNCLFQYNEAARGGAVSVGGNGSQVIVYDTGFLRNTAVDGGAVHVDAGGVLEVAGHSPGACVFVDNQASGGGGAIWIEAQGAAAVAGCVFLGNTAGDDAGALKAKGVVEVRNSSFEENSALDKGGAVQVASGGEGWFEDVTFRQNSAWLGGGAMVYTARPRTEAHFARCLFEGNVAARYSGGLRVAAGDQAGAAAVWVSDSLFAGNVAEDVYGGGGSAAHGAVLHLVNCTVVGNRAARGTGRTGGFSAYQGGVLIVQNSIFWDNEGFDLNASTAQIQVWHSDVEDPGPGVLDQGGLFSEDPRFEPGGYHLSGASPCLDRGDDSVVTSTLDLDGNPRRVDLPGVNNGGVVDLGAFERQQP